MRVRSPNTATVQKCVLSVTATGKKNFKTDFPQTNTEYNFESFKNNHFRLFERAETTKINARHSTVLGTTRFSALLTLYKSKV